MIYSFYKYHDIKEFDNRSLESKYFLASFSNDLDKFSSLLSKKKKCKREKKQTCTIQRHNYIVPCQEHILIIL